MAPDAKEIRQAEREEKRNEKERTREEKTKAYIALEDEQKALYKDIADLEEQFPLTITIPGAGPTRTISPEAQGIIDAKHARIDQIEKDLEKIYNSTLGFVVGRSKKQRLEDMVAAASGAEAAKAAPKEQIAELKTDTLALAAQHLMAAGLLPGDLKGDEPKRSQAARLVGREGASPAELSAFADELQPAYDIEMNIKKAAEDMEKGVVVGRTMDAIKEVAGNPAKMGGAALGLLGAWLLYSAVGHGPSDGAMKWIKGILGVAGLGVGIGVVSGALSYKNIGLGDAVEKLTGVRADEAFSTESMDKVRHLFDGMPSTDTDAVDDFIRIMDAPVENVADMFRDALEKGATEVEAARLLNNGLSSKEKKFVDEGSLYTSCSWFFLKCYEQGLAKGDLATTTDEKTKLLLGLDWSKKNFKGHQMGTAVAAFELVRLGSGTGTVETTGTPETGIKDPELARLAKEAPIFGDVLKSTNKPGVYLIKGYPVRYNHTDAGGHIFTDILNPTKKFTDVRAGSTGDALEVTLSGISTEAETRAKAFFAAKYPAITGSFKYNSSSLDGYWDLDPKVDRVPHDGLPHYKEDKKVELVFYFDVEQGVSRIGLDEDQDGVVDPLPGDRNTPYTSIDEAKKDFEKGILHTRVTADISSTLLVPFTVTGARETGTTTEVDIIYGTSKGVVIYKGDKIDSFNLPDETELNKKWTEAAQVKQAKFLAEPRVQAALLRATTNYTGYDESLIGGLVSKFLGKGMEIVDWVKNDSIQNKFANDWEEQVIRKMTEIMYNPVTGFNKLYVDGVFKAWNSNDKFQGAEDTWMNTQITSLEGSGVLMATVIPEKEPDSQLTITQAIDKARGDGAAAIAIALAPLKDRVPATMPSRFASAAQSIGNLFTGDAARTELYKKEAGKWQKELEKRVSTLFSVPAGPAAAGSTPPALIVPTRDQVQYEIDKIQIEIQREAVKYVGLDNQTAVRQLLLAPVEIPGAHPDWKAASVVMADYLTNHFKWENYGVFPNPENLAAVMDIWYEKIGDPTVAPLAGPAEEYAAYFRWEVWVRLGGNRDWSPDRLYDGTIESVSDSQFKANIGGLRGGIQDFSTWSKKVKLRPPVPSMETSLDKYKPVVTAQFEKWYEDNNTIEVWSRISRWGPQMFRWRDIYKETVDSRFNDILIRSTNPADLYKDVEDFKKFMSAERHLIYEPLIMAGVEPEHWGFEITTDVISGFHKVYFNPIPPAKRDLPGYIGYIKKNMYPILDSFHTFPNWPGIPFA